MDGEDPIERIVVPRESLLTIGDDHRETVALGDLGRKLIRCLEGDILSARFELNMRTRTRSDFQRSQS